MSKLTILIDMDDTLENLCETWIECLNEIYTIGISLDDIKVWDMTKNIPMLSETEIFAPLHKEDLWKRVKPLPGSVVYVKRLIDDGHRVVIVTASHYDTVEYKLNNVLFKYFPFLTNDDVIVTSKKQLIKGDVLIDDSPSNLIGGGYKGILMTAPHNRRFDAKSAGFIRVDNWKEAYKAVCEISKER